MSLQNETNLKSPYLSIVVAARNDNHGGNMLKRMQIFTNGILAQAEKFKLPCELIVVEWNPPADKLPLGEALTWPRQSEYCNVRFIVFPRELHDRYKHAAQLPLYQMIAKNVGIRRARGEFVIATNIDILFSDELFAFMASRQLDPRRMYRCQRHDVNEEIPLELSQAEHLEYCRSNIVRINSRYSSEDLITGDIVLLKGTDDETVNGVADLHTNACGDFTMLSRDAWFRLHGYPEFDMYSFHLDSLLCHMAHHTGYREVDLSPPLLTYHIEHGGGFKPKDMALDQQLTKKKIVKMSNGELFYYERQMHELKQPIIFNDDNWGIAGDELQEYSPFSTGWNIAASHPSATSPLLKKLPSCTLATVLRPGTSADRIRQINALRNWRLFLPDSPIMIFGSDEESAMLADQFDAAYTAVDAGPFEVPRLADVLEKICARSAHEMVVWLEPDVIMTDSFIEGVLSLQTLDMPLVAGGRTNTIFVASELSFCHPVMSEILVKQAQKTDFLSDSDDPGYLIFKQCPNFSYIPPFSLSTPDWKCWLLGQAQRLKISVIDTTPAMLVPRQMFFREPKPDAAFNALLKGQGGINLAEVSLRQTPQGIKESSGVPPRPEMGLSDYYRLAFHSFEEAMILREIIEGILMLYHIERHLKDCPEALYALYVQRGKLLLIARAYEYAKADFLKAIRIDNDENLSAPELYRMMRFITITDQKFVPHRYALQLSEPSSVLADADNLVRHRDLCRQAARYFSDGHLLQAIKYLEDIIVLAPKTVGARLGIAICLARTGRVHEAIPYAEAELKLQTPHVDALFLLESLRQSLTIPDESS